MNRLFRATLVFLFLLGFQLEMEAQSSMVVTSGAVLGLGTLVAGGPTPFDFVIGYLSGDINLDGKVSYSGAQNDRVDILTSAGGPTAFDSRNGQVPNIDP